MLLLLPWVHHAPVSCMSRILQQQQVGQPNGLIQVHPRHLRLVVVRTVRPHDTAQVVRVVQLEVDRVTEVDGMHGAVRVVLLAPAAEYVVLGVVLEQLRDVALDGTEGGDGDGGLGGVEAVEAVGAVDEGEVDGEEGGEDEEEEEEENESYGVHGDGVVVGTGTGQRLHRSVMLCGGCYEKSVRRLFGWLVSPLLEARQAG